VLLRLQPQERGAQQQIAGQVKWLLRLGHGEPLDFPLAFAPGLRPEGLRGGLVGGLGCGPVGAGATGTATFNTVGSYLQFGFKGGDEDLFGGFGQFTFISNGTLTLPQHADLVLGDEDHGDGNQDED